MALRFYFTMEPDWRTAPMAFWVHIPEAAGAWVPPAPTLIPHHGYAFLHVDVGDVDLQFSAMPQLEHFIDVIGRKPLPTSRQLSVRRGGAAGPNSHWLSRLPARLKSPKFRAVLARELQTIRQQIVASNCSWAAASARPGYPK
jgi:hypothetical protein